jgi:putative transcriptional regulator
MDPNFARSVVLMLEHSSEGALGLVLNNPLPTKLGDVAQGLQLQWLGDADARVRLGGPVEPIRGWILHDQATWDPSADEVMPGVYVTTSLEPVTTAGRNRIGHRGSNYQLLLGYAGWAPTQLESEIAAGSWVAVPFDLDGLGFGLSPRFVFDVDPAQMWDEALRSIGVDPARMTRRAGDAARA